MQPTSEKLAQALMDAGAPYRLVTLAREGRYDDFKSESATPISDLVRDLNLCGLRDLAQRAMNGDFDSTKEEAEEWFAKEGKDLLLKGGCGD